MIANRIARRCGARLSLGSARRLLAQLGLTCQKLLRLAYQYDGSRVEQWLKQEYPKIPALTKREKARSCFEDEYKVHSDLCSGGTWMARGQTPVACAEGRRFSLNVVLAISPSGASRFVVVKGEVGAWVFINSLKHLTYGHCRPVFLIVDGYQARRTKSVKSYIACLQRRVHLYFLPSCLPELNPDKLVWTKVKNDAVEFSRSEDPKELYRAVVVRFQFPQRRPDRVRNFFHSPETRYAV